MSRSAKDELPTPAERVWKPQVYRGFRYVFAAYFAWLILELLTSYEYGSESWFPYVLDFSMDSSSMEMLVICAAPLALLWSCRAGRIELRGGRLFAKRALFKYREMTEVLPSETIVGRGLLWNRGKVTRMTLRNGEFRADVLRRELGDEDFEALLAVATRAQ